MKTAVLFLVFNRPEPTRRVFEAIRKARPRRLYVAADGPRPDRAGEAELCAEVRRIASNVDWPCEVKTLTREHNLGCKHGVSSAIDWFFTQEEEGIILEDDVLPQPSFFTYCEKLLPRYRYDDHVSMISGCNLLGKNFRSQDSYFFSRYMHVWGWATWRRAWSHFSVTMEGWPSFASSAKLDAVVCGRRNAARHWSKVFDDVKCGKIDSWAYPWVHAGWMNDMVAIIPSHNLVENIGFGPDATHTTGAVPAAVREAGTGEMTFPLRHPERTSIAAADPIIERVAMGIGGMAQVRSRIRTLALVRKVATLYKATKWQTR